MRNARAAPCMPGAGGPRPRERAQAQRGGGAEARDEPTRGRSGGAYTGRLFFFFFFFFWFRVRVGVGVRVRRRALAERTRERFFGKKKRAARLVGAAAFRDARIHARRFRVARLMNTRRSVREASALVFARFVLERGERGRGRGGGARDGRGRGDDGGGGNVAGRRRAARELGQTHDAPGGGTGGLVRGRLRFVVAFDALGVSRRAFPRRRRGVRALARARRAAVVVGHGVPARKAVAGGGRARSFWHRARNPARGLNSFRGFPAASSENPSRGRPGSEIFSPRTGSPLTTAPLPAARAARFG